MVSVFRAPLLISVLSILVCVAFIYPYTAALRRSVFESTSTLGVLNEQGYEPIEDKDALLTEIARSKELIHSEGKMRHGYSLHFTMCLPTIVTARSKDARVAQNTMEKMETQVKALQELIRSTVEHAENFRKIVEETKASSNSAADNAAKQRKELQEGIDAFRAELAEAKKSRDKALSSQSSTAKIKADRVAGEQADADRPRGADAEKAEAERKAEAEKADSEEKARAVRQAEAEAEVVASIERSNAHRLKAGTATLVRRNDTIPPFVFVHLGLNPVYFPNNFSIGAQQVAKWNPGAIIHIVVPRVFTLHPSVIAASLTPNANVTVWAIEDIPQTKLHNLFTLGSGLNNGFRGGFWRLATERLFILHDFLEMQDIDEAIHTENDCLIYVPIRSIIHALRTHYPGLTMTPHASAGFVYMGNRSALTMLCGTMVNAWGDDMLMLNKFAHTYGPTLMGALPVIAPGDVRGLAGSTRNYDAIGGLFDGAPHGQYVGGPDPVNRHGGPGFVNGQAPYRVSDFEYEWTIDPSTKLRRMQMRKLASKGGSGEWRQLFHLHIHCKDLAKFAS